LHRIRVAAARERLQAARAEMYRCAPHRGALRRDQCQTEERKVGPVVGWADAGSPTRASPLAPRQAGPPVLSCPFAQEHHASAVTPAASGFLRQRNGHEARASPAMMRVPGSPGAAERNSGSSAAHRPIPSFPGKCALVIPAKAGIQCEPRPSSRGVQGVLDSRVRGNDDDSAAFERTRTEPEDAHAPAVPAAGSALRFTRATPATARGARA
jgi:hypothetical protein